MPPKKAKKRAAGSQPWGASAAKKRAAGSRPGGPSAEAKEATQPMARAREARANECIGDAGVVEEEPICVAASKDIRRGRKPVPGITQSVRLNLTAIMHEVPCHDLAKELPFAADQTPIDYLMGCSSSQDKKTFWSTEVVGRLMVSRCGADTRAMRYIEQKPDWKRKWEQEMVSASPWWPPYI